MGSAGFFVFWNMISLGTMTGRDYLALTFEICTIKWYTYYSLLKETIKMSRKALVVIDIQNDISGLSGNQKCQA